MMEAKDFEVKMIDANRFLFEGSGVITLCGSTKFFFEHMQACRVLAFLDWMVWQSGSFGHSYHKYSMEEVRDYSIVKKLHFEKIRRSDAVIVVSDESGYIGTSTKAEIAFAEAIHLPVYYFNGVQFSGVCHVIEIPKRVPDKAVTKFLNTYEGDTGITNA